MTNPLQENVAGNVAAQLLSATCLTTKEPQALGIKIGQSQVCNQEVISVPYNVAGGSETTHLVTENQPPGQSRKIVTVRKQHNEVQ